jgi:Zn-finger nucleic acid-binding protein
MKNNSMCPKCGNGFRMGHNGTVDGCDKCTGVTRDKNGFAWSPSDRVHAYEDIATGKTFKVKRTDAFKK